MNNFLKHLHKFKEIDPTMQIATVLALCEIAKANAEDREISTRDIEELLSVTSGTASRNISYWAEGNTMMVGAHGYVVIDFHSQDRRLRSLKLTHKGKAFIKKVFGE